MAPEYQVSLIPSHHVDQAWGNLSEGLEKACLRTGGDIGAHYLWTECRSGRAFLYAIYKNTTIVGASVWRFDNWTTGRKLRCLAMYGEDMEKWRDGHLDVIKSLAEVGGADAIVAEGRRGLARIFPGATVLRQLYEVPL